MGYLYPIHDLSKQYAIKLYVYTAKWQTIDKTKTNKNNHLETIAAIMASNARQSANTYPYVHRSADN